MASPMSRMSSLKRREEETVPSWPALSMRTVTALALPVVTPRMPAMKARVCPLPMRIVLTAPKKK